MGFDCNDGIRDVDIIPNAIHLDRRMIDNMLKTTIFVMAVNFRSFLWISVRISIFFRNFLDFMYTTKNKTDEENASSPDIV
jgi:hypothetical protein